MDVGQLNYHHLRYFWAVAREGSVTRASQKLHISQPTVSAQIRELESALGEKLLMRSGRNLVLTDVGRLVYRYADEIFGLGRELMDALEGRPTGRPLKLSVGIVNVVPKLVAYRILEPALSLPEAVELECFEDRPERLLAELAVHGLDVVLTDSPVPSSVKIKAYNHLLGECGVALFATPELAARHRGRLPGSLQGAPLLLPTSNTSLRRELDRWLERHSISPRIVGEFEDSALLKVFGQSGVGLFPAPVAIAAEVAQQYGVRRVGVLEGVHERFYVISAERRLQHPAVVALSQAARTRLFGE
jgi:LysR family transcriptional activator of nhaA